MVLCIGIYNVNIGFWLHIGNLDFFNHGDTEGTEFHGEDYFISSQARVTGNNVGCPFVVVQRISERSAELVAA